MFEIIKSNKETVETDSKVIDKRLKYLACEVCSNRNLAKQPNISQFLWKNIITSDLISAFILLYYIIQFEINWYVGCHWWRCSWFGRGHHVPCTKGNNPLQSHNIAVRDENPLRNPWQSFNNKNKVVSAAILFSIRAPELQCTANSKYSQWHPAWEHSSLRACRPIRYYLF